MTVLELRDGVPSGGHSAVDASIYPVFDDGTWLSVDAETLPALFSSPSVASDDAGHDDITDAVNTIISSLAADAATTYAPVEAVNEKMDESTMTDISWNWDDIDELLREDHAYAKSATTLSFVPMPSYGNVTGGNVQLEAVSYLGSANSHGNTSFTFVNCLSYCKVTLYTLILCWQQNVIWIGNWRMHITH